MRPPPGGAPAAVAAAPEAENAAPAPAAVGAAAERSDAGVTLASVPSASDPAALMASVNRGGK